MRKEYPRKVTFNLLSKISQISQNPPQKSGIHGVLGCIFVHLSLISVTQCLQVGRGDGMGRNCFVMGAGVGRKMSGFQFFGGQTRLTSQSEV